MKIDRCKMKTDKSKMETDKYKKKTDKPKLNILIKNIEKTDFRKW